MVAGTLECINFELFALLKQLGSEAEALFTVAPYVVLNDLINVSSSKMIAAPYCINPSV